MRLTQKDSMKVFVDGLCSLAMESKNDFNTNIFSIFVQYCETIFILLILDEIDTFHNII